MSWFTIFAVCTLSGVFYLVLMLLSHTYIVFEMVSAYGTVGLSLGVPSVESFSDFHDCCVCTNALFLPLHWHKSRITRSQAR